MTTLRKLISQIDLNNTSTKDDPNWERLAYEFDIFNLGWSEDKRLQCHFIRKWYCTDSYVGLRAYFLDGEFIATSWQSGRKMNEEFSFTSEETAKKVRDYLLSLVEEEEGLRVDILDQEQLDMEISDTFKIEYNTQILHSTGVLNGERVNITRKHYPYQEKDKHFHTVEVEKQNGERLEIDCRELDFEYNV